MLLEYIDYISKVQYSHGFIFVLDNLKKMVDSLNVEIYISENPAEVPVNIYKFMKISESRNLIKISKIYKVDKPYKQKVLIEFKGEVLLLKYSILNASESELIKYIINKSHNWISLEIIDNLLKGSDLSYILLNSKQFLEEASKSDTDIDKLIYLYLTIITIGTGGEFNRAVFFQKSGNKYIASRALGFKGVNEANEIWNYMEKYHYDFEDKIREYKKMEYFSSLEKEIKHFYILEEDFTENDFFKEVLYNENNSIIIPSSILPKKLNNKLNIEGQCAISILKSNNGILGFVIADNKYNLKNITNNQLYFLDYISKQFSILYENKRHIESLKLEAKKDFLTGFYNRRSFDKYVNSLEQGKQDNVGIVIIDMDNFKKVNDEYGHHMGDELLRDISKIILDNIRETDKAFRYGGDEFVLMFENITKEDLYKILERIKNEYNKKTGYTFSAGAIICENPKEINKFIRRADEVLYEIKKSSKGKILIK
ncbi:GGDEF domain-containing protein [Marinitoga litoralis]|uniref:GGDEF domain-containing protein n=1 Tax=Marinitoga litoralis TaxID=570855 RepID=UPI0019604CB7|nr:GGDEF domain-containing protein [Marinitoga litoralis]MBM7559493.1 diguanylate cyclase (GGDEF)-like protein [Marinitoga litoralis]